jgi:hypothetical protein
MGGKNGGRGGGLTETENGYGRTRGEGGGSEKNERTRILWMAPYIKCRFRRRDISA